MPDPNASPPSEPPLIGWRWACTYAALPERLFTRVEPTPVRAPRMVVLNEALATTLGLRVEGLVDGKGLGVFAGNTVPAGAEPLAQAYAGHQFGHPVMLGDGRAVLLGEHRTPAGELVDIQLKGSGPTPYSRRGDGRAALEPMLREYVISEAMHALGIPTTRSLAVVTTGEEIWREAGALPGAVLTRVAASHVRVGTFEFVAAQRDPALTEALIDFTLRRHYPELRGALPADNALALLRVVVERQAALIAQWMSVGFVHGVMNTDNMALSGETIDYGPCAFLDTYDPATVFSSIDRHGRYAYGNQPSIGLWNLTRFAETLLPVIHPEEKAAVALATEVLNTYGPSYDQQWLARMREKLGLFNEEGDDEALAQDLLKWMHETKADFTHTFAELDPDAPVPDETLASWWQRWRERLTRQPQSATESAELRAASNPMVIPRNHRVEAALNAAGDGDLAPLETLLKVVVQPFDRAAVPAEFREPPTKEAGPYVTFCGT